MKVMKNGKEWTTDSINARAILGERARNVFEAYDNTKPYVVNNKVAYEGSSYVNILASTGILPTDETHWLLIAAKGADGTIGTIGTDGADGLSAYEIAVNNGYVGTEAEWVASLSLVPTELTGFAGKALAVNETEDGLIFADIASTATDVSVADTGAYYAGTNAETVLQEIGATLITKADASALALKADISALYSGATLLTGTTDPTDDMGQDGDVYIKYY